MDGKTTISVFIGGFIGGVVRYWLGQFFTVNGVLIANLTGCFLLAFLTYYVLEKGRLSSWLNAGIGTGFVGAFTTFSSLMTATAKLGQDDLLAAFTYLMVSAVGGLMMAGLGFLCGNYCGKKGQND